MDVVDFNVKVDIKILQLAEDYYSGIDNDGESCLWKDIYLLSEALSIVNNELTPQECIDNVIAALDCKYRLSDLEERGTVGIGKMTINPITGCNVFTVYEI